jgi:DNA-binding FrmR family transcriptional regulator
MDRYPTRVYVHGMHTLHEKKKLISRVKRIRGQLEAAETAIIEERGCSDVLQTLAAARGAMNGLVAEIVEDHIRFHVLDPAGKTSAKQTRAAEELIDVVRAYVK